MNQTKQQKLQEKRELTSAGWWWYERTGTGLVAEEKGGGDIYISKGGADGGFWDLWKEERLQTQETGAPSTSTTAKY